MHCMGAVVVAAEKTGAGGDMRKVMRVRRL